MLFSYLKALHLIAIVTWFSGLFYLPRLFVYHSMASDFISQARFKLMERRLYYGIAYPSMIAVIISGSALLHLQPLLLSQNWFKAKLIFILSLIIYHFCCGYWVKLFKKNQSTYSHVFYRFFNEFPTLILISVMILVCVRP